MLLTLNSDEYIVSFWNKATCKRTQQLPITHNKRTQHVTSNNFASVWPGYAMIANSVKHTQTSINRPLAKFCSKRSRTARSLCGASRDFKMPRRRRRRKQERQKSNRLQIGKTKTVHMKHTFLYISFRHCKITTRKCLVSPQFLKWNGSETHQTPLFYVFVSFFGTDRAQRSIAFLSFSTY